MIAALKDRLEQRQGRIYLGTQATALRIEGGRCAGVAASRAGADLTFAAPAVVIADGGFPGDPELFRLHIGPHPERVLQRHAGTAVGDGLRMAERAGAALTRLDQFYGHLLSRDAMRDDGLWPYPQIDAVATAGIVVDTGGRRLLDEGLGGISITNDLARLDDPLCATVICDAAIWDTAGRAAQIPPNPQLVEGGGTLHEAGTMEELAALAGLDPATLRATVEAYNAAVRNGRLAELSPPRSAKSGAPAPDRDAAVLCDPDLRRHHEHVRRYRDRRARQGSPSRRLDHRGPVRGGRLHRRARRRRRPWLCRRADQGLRPRPARRRGRRPPHPAGRGIAPDAAAAVPLAARRRTR